MTGLEYDLREKILGFNPHVTLASFSGGLADWQDGRSSACARCPT